MREAGRCAHQGIRADAQPPDRAGRLRDGGRATKVERVTALALTAVALALQVLFVLHAGALWRDEVNSVETASATSGASFEQRLEFESFPAAWLALLRVWMLLAGGSDTALRIAGALGGLTLVAAVWIAMWRLGRTVPLVSLALLAVNPEVVRWSGSIRAWGLGAALALTSLVAVYEATVRPTRWRVIVAAVVCVLSVHTTYQNGVLLVAVVVPAILLAVVLKNWKGAVAGFGIGAVAIASLFPYVGAVLRRREWDGLNQLSVSVVDLGTEFGRVIGAAGPLGLMGWVSLGIAVIVLRRHAGPGRDARWYVMAALTLSLSLIAALYLGFQYPTRPWYYLALVSMAAVCGELLLVTAQPAAWLSRGRALAAACIAVVSLTPTIRALAVPQSNIDVVAATLAARTVPRDLVVASPWYYGVSLSRYHRGPAELRTIPPMADVRVHRYDLLKAAMLNPSTIEPLLRQMRAVLSAGGRVWIVGPIARLPEAPHGRLPSPPLSATGWHSAPYEWSWLCEAGSFLASHAASVTPLPLGRRGGPFEDAGLLLAQGWR